MSDKKLNQANPVAKPQELKDEQLEDAQGGYGYQLHNVEIKSFSTHGSSGDVAPESEAKKFSSK